LALAAAALLYGVWWSQQVLGGFLGAVAIGLLLLPYFGWCEFKQDAARTAEANTMMTAHSLATDEFVQSRLDHAQSWLQEEREKDRGQISALIAERNNLNQRLQPFIATRERDNHGRFLRLKHTPLLSHSTGGQIALQLPIERPTE
jgi:hypothetical protein